MAIHKNQPSVMRVRAKPMSSAAMHPAMAPEAPTRATVLAGSVRWCATTPAMPAPK